MRISDWSSDVCSSDLHGRCDAGKGRNEVVRPSYLPFLLTCACQGPQSFLERGIGRTPAQHSLGLAISHAPVFGIEGPRLRRQSGRSEEHTSELQSLMRISYAVFCLKKKTRQQE